MDLIKVYAKAMNRTALGIVNAYFKLHPNVTFKELKEKFPDSLYEEVEGGFFNTIKPLGVFQSKKIVDELPSKQLQQCHFMKDDEILKTSDGIEICVSSSWGKIALNKLIEHSKQYGIIVAESLEHESFKKGEYRLEMINQNVTPIPQIPEKKNHTFIYIGIFLIVLIAIIFYFYQKPEKVIEKVKVETVDSVIKQEEVITFHNIFFDNNQSILKKGSETDLDKLLQYFHKYPNMTILITGHTDKTTNSQEEYNLKLSLDRANAVKQWLTERNVQESNIQTDGKGFNEPIADNSTEDGKAKNRRIEIKILSK